MKIHCLYDELVDPSSLKPNPLNTNLHPDFQIERLAKILEYQGWRHAIKISKRSGYITSGHGRLSAALLLGYDKVPVVYQDYETEDQETADITSDNAIASWSSIDISKLNEQVKDFDPSFDIELLGLKNFLIDPSEKLTPDSEWVDMPEFDQKDKTSFRHIIVHFLNEKHVADFFRAIGQSDTGQTKSIWYPKQENMDTESKRYG